MDQERRASGNSTVTPVTGDLQLFDLAGLSRRIDEVREQRGLTMTALAHKVGVAASTIRRFRTASDAEADGVLALISWLGDTPEQFIRDSSVEGAPLPQAGTGQIRVDMALVAEATQGIRTSTRTTIQRLAVAAQGSERSIASLTRWSPF